MGKTELLAECEKRVRRQKWKIANMPVRAILECRRTTNSLVMNNDAYPIAFGSFMYDELIHPLAAQPHTHYA